MFTKLIIIFLIFSIISFTVIFDIISSSVIFDIISWLPFDTIPKSLTSKAVEMKYNLSYGILDSTIKTKIILILKN